MLPLFIRKQYLQLIMSPRYQGECLKNDFDFYLLFRDPLTEYTGQTLFGSRTDVQTKN